MPSSSEHTILRRRVAMVTHDGLKGLRTRFAILIPKRQLQYHHEEEPPHKPKKKKEDEELAVCWKFVKSWLKLNEGSHFILIHWHQMKQRSVKHRRQRASVLKRNELGDKDFQSDTEVCLFSAGQAISLLT